MTRAGALYLGDPDAAYSIAPEAQARLLGVMFAEHRLAKPAAKPKTNPFAAVLRR